MYWAAIANAKYYNDTQMVQQQNYAKLETALKQVEKSINAMREQETTAVSTKKLQEDLQKAEQYGDNPTNSLTDSYVVTC